MRFSLVTIVIVSGKLIELRILPIALRTKAAAEIHGFRWIRSDARFLSTLILQTQLNFFIVFNEQNYKKKQ